MLWPRRSSSPQRMRRRRPVVLCVDVEPDARTFDPADPPPWNGFERFLERLPPLRQHLEQITDAPVRVTWFLRMDPQVEQTWGSPEWVVDAYGSALDELWEGGDELGLHTHTWRWGHEDWYTEREDEAWTARCIDGGVDAF